jgi:hypothetical protein
VKISQFFTFNAILFIGLGIAFTLYGPLMVNFYGILETESSGISYWYVTSFARMYGVILFGYGFLIWAIKDIPENDKTSPQTRRKIIFAQLITSIVGLVVATIQQITIWWNITGWMTVVLFLVLAIVYLYYFISDQRVSSDKAGDEDAY